MFFPIRQAPGWRQALSKVNPMTYGVDAIRQVFLGRGRGAALRVNLFGHVMTVAGVVFTALLGAAFLGRAVLAFSRQE